MKYAVLNLPRESDTLQTYGIKHLELRQHAACAWLGIRPALGQHTALEHETMKRLAQGRHVIVEIGVAEGVSALALREGMADDGKLYLIDPYHLSRFRALNFVKRAAHRTVDACRKGEVIWIEKFSQEAASIWRDPIDLLLIDGDHGESAVARDWDEWSKFVKPGGLAMFHDSRLFEGGWTTPNYGPVRFVDRAFRESKMAGWQIIEEIHSLFVVQRAHA